MTKLSEYLWICVICWLTNMSYRSKVIRWFRYVISYNLNHGKRSDWTSLC